MFGGPRGRQKVGTALNIDAYTQRSDRALPPSLVDPEDGGTGGELITDLPSHIFSQSIGLHVHVV